MLRAGYGRNRLETVPKMLFKAGYFSNFLFQMCLCFSDIDIVNLISNPAKKLYYIMEAVIFTLLSVTETELLVLELRHYLIYFYA